MQKIGANDAVLYYLYDPMKTESLPTPRHKSRRQLVDRGREMK